MKLASVIGVQLLGGAAILSLLGCGKPPAGVPVTGHVSYKGTPVADSAVTFYPESGRAIVASTSESGNYSATLPAGPYGVAISIGVKPPAGWKEGDPIPAPKVVLPPQYSSRAKSTLTADVQPGQSEPINFDLK